MKKIIALIAVALFATAAFAQDTKSDKLKDLDHGKYKGHECYAMKEGVINHCTGDKAEPIKETVKLKNGTTISPEGVVTTEGQETKMDDGQCISLMGSIGDCMDMHKDLEKSMKSESKMN